MEQNYNRVYIIVIVGVDRSSRDSRVRYNTGIRYQGTGRVDFCSYGNIMAARGAWGSHAMPALTAWPSWSEYMAHPGSFRRRPCSGRIVFVTLC